MFSLFTSSTRLQVQSAASPDQILNEFRDRMQISHDPLGFSTLFSPVPGPGRRFRGTVEGANVEVRYVNSSRNSLQPTMHIHVESSASGGSVILTRYSSSIFVKVFFIIWMFIASSGAISKLSTGAVVSPVVAAFPFFGIVVLVLMRTSARVDEKALENLVHEVADRATLQAGAVR